MVQNLPVKQETWIPSLGREDSLEKKMATRSSILAQEIPWTEEPGGLQSKGSQRIGHNLVTKQQQQQLQSNPIVSFKSFLNIKKKKIWESI